MDAADDAHLRRALELAWQARMAGDPPFGSLLVAADASVLAEERNTVASTGDITAHPELKIARWAAQHLDQEAARAATMYTSCEPCPMCTNAIARSGIGRVVFALSTQQLGDLKPAGFVDPASARVVYVGPALPGEAARPVAGYYG